MNWLIHIVRWLAIATFVIGIWDQNTNQLIVGGVLYLASLMWSIEDRL